MLSVLTFEREITVRQVKKGRLHKRMEERVVNVEHSMWVRMPGKCR